MHSPRARPRAASVGAVIAAVFALTGCIWGDAPSPPPETSPTAGPAPIPWNQLQPQIGVAVRGVTSAKVTQVHVKITVSNTSADTIWRPVPAVTDIMADPADSRTMVIGSRVPYVARDDEFTPGADNQPPYIEFNAIHPGETSTETLVVSERSPLAGWTQQVPPGRVRVCIGYLQNHIVEVRGNNDPPSDRIHMDRQLARDTQWHACSVPSEVSEQVAARLTATP